MRRHMAQATYPGATRAAPCSPIRSCSGWSLPCHATLSPRAVRSYRTVSPLPDPLRAIGGLFSVALVVGSRRPGVTWHPALWSPDFPRDACAPRDCPADSAVDFSRSGPGLQTGPHHAASRNAVCQCARSSRLKSCQRSSGKKMRAPSYSTRLRVPGIVASSQRDQLVSK